jgi:ABC-type dipeptide/oligopeptide/nickel transport system permease subunit
LEKTATDISGRVTQAQLDEFARLQRIENRSKTTHKILRNKGTIAGILLLLIVFLLAIFGPMLVEYDYTEMTADLLEAPSLKHLFGTDFYGRDTFTRTLEAARTSLLIALCATFLSTLLGVFFGMISGFYGKSADRVIMGVSDIFMAIPVLLFAVCIIAIFGRSTMISIIAITVTSIPGVLRIARGQTLSLKQREFVLALRSMGIGNLRIIFKHLLPNVIAPVIVMSTISVGFAVMIESALAYIGMGVPIPGCSLGSLVMEGRSFVTTAWWLSTLPGIYIALIVLGFNLFGDGLRDISDYHDIT